jgi:hypothetical protein
MDSKSGILMVPLKNVLLRILVLLPFLAATGCMLSDEQILREEFHIPSSAKLVEIVSSPEQPGWFGREGLEITATFQFSDADFSVYKKAEKIDRTWLPTPPTKDFIFKITGIRSYRAGLQRSNEVLSEHFPEGTAFSVPSEDELYRDWKERLPLDISQGYYQCKTAGNDILHATKVLCSDRQGDLNDFMLAVIDEEQLELKVFVYTSY